MLDDVAPEARPHGAWIDRQGGFTWSLWAPNCDEVSLVRWPDGRRTETPMEPVGYGYFMHRRAELPAHGERYAFKLPHGWDRPDPASRWQPDGVHEPSAVFYPDRFEWSDAGWGGVALEDLVVYELHVGTFTEEGTFDAVLPRLPELAELGVTAIEIMPVGQFPGGRNWGYDGVQPYAVQSTYGGPEGFQRLVDAAHRAGLAVILDVIYNHFGPEGAYFHEFGPYTTDRYKTPWGQAMNYDGPDSDRVRRFVIDNAHMWVRDFHVDGLRLDAVHAIYDKSPSHVLADIQEAVQAEAQRRNRAVHVFAETHENNVRYLWSRERGGMGLDGIWNDEFHHAVHAFLTGERDGYYSDYGSAYDVAKAFNEVFVHDGTYSRFWRRRHGTRVGELARSRFVAFIQNHDQVGNRPGGDRLNAIVAPEARRLAAALLLLWPGTPLLFMGEEYAEPRPFPFFCSFGDPGLIEAVRKGRLEEFAAMNFQWEHEPADPQDPETFQSAKLSWSWPEGSFQAQTRRLYQDLLAGRRRWPGLRTHDHTTARLLDVDPGDGDPSQAMVLERGPERSLLVVANLDARHRPAPDVDPGPRRRMLSTEQQRYGGPRPDDPDEAPENPLPGELRPWEAVVLAPGEANGA